MSADHLSASERLAVVRAALDQARAVSEQTTRRAGLVVVGAREWKALIHAIEPPVEQCVCQVRIPKGDAKGRTLAEVAESTSGPAWFHWATRRAPRFWPTAFQQALDEFVATHWQEAA